MLRLNAEGYGKSNTSSHLNDPVGRLPVATKITYFNCQTIMTKVPATGESDYRHTITIWLGLGKHSSLG